MSGHNVLNTSPVWSTLNTLTSLPLNINILSAFLRKIWRQQGPECDYGNEGKSGGEYKRDLLKLSDSMFLLIDQ